MLGPLKDEIPAEMRKDYQNWCFSHTNPFLSSGSNERLTKPARGEIRGETFRRAPATLGAGLPTHRELSGASDFEYIESGYPKQSISSESRVSLAPQPLHAFV